MNLTTIPPGQPPQQSVTLFWQVLGRLFARLLGERAHADLVVAIRDGKVQRVHVNRSYLPNDLPQV